MDEKLFAIEAELKEAITDFLVPLQTTRVIKQDAFERLHSSAKEICRQLKGNQLVPKSLLNEIYVTALVIKTEQSHFEDRAALLEEMSHQLEMCFILILKDESPEDRQPGVPRII